MAVAQWREWFEQLAAMPAFPDAAKIAAAVFVGFIVHVIVIRLTRHFLRRAGANLEEDFFRRLKHASRMLFAITAVVVVSPALTVVLSEQDGLTRHLLVLGLLASSVWLILVALSGFEEHIKRTHRVDVADNYLARRLHTRITVLKRVISIFVMVVAVALALMTFPGVRQVGASLLASAGVAGLVIGLAARPMLENLIAGVQLALTQPIALDDVVIVEGEWGWVEEVGTTYVVIRIWDQRRLIVPFSKFLQEPFQNWTRRTAELLGTVFLYTDYTVPVQAVREELKRIVEGHDKWDGRVCVLQVTDATERTVQLRALVSAANSPSAWDLRVYVREKLIEYLQREHPEALPRTRVELPADASSPGDAGRDRETSNEV